MAQRALLEMTCKQTSARTDLRGGDRSAEAVAGSKLVQGVFERVASGRNRGFSRDSLSAYLSQARITKQHDVFESHIKTT